MPTPIAPTEFAGNFFEPEWYERDFFHSPDGVKEFPRHHCKKTFFTSLPFIDRFRNAIDIGCRDGEYSRYLQHYFGHTYAFDPNFKKTFAYNVDLSKVTHYNCALGDEAGSIFMSGSGHKFIEGLHHEVPVFLLDHFELTDIDYIKIDVEGFERKVMMGGERTILRDRPVIVIEQNEVRLETEEPFAAKMWLEERGYAHVATCARGWDHVMKYEG